MTYQEYVRLKKLYSGLTEKDKLFLSSLQNQQNQLNEVLRRLGRYPFAQDLVANVSGNFLTQGLSYLAKKLIKM